MRKLYVVIFFYLYAIAFASTSIRNFSFIIFGDNRAHSSSSISQPKVFKKMIQEMNCYKDEVAFAINLGDIVRANSSSLIYKLQLNQYLKCINQLYFPVYNVVGNEEISGHKEIENIYKEKLRNTYYSFEYKNCLFIILDTEEIGHEGNIEDKQLLWLEKELQKNASMKFICMHRPLFPVIHKSHMKKENFYQLLTLFKKNGVNAIFAGHDHCFHNSIQDGILQVVSGGGGAPLYDHPSPGIKVHHFCLITITDNNIKVKMIPIR
ncbi:MAG: metallophosphoesterase [bacterium]|nr:metallophosphoesterase [bacterium]